MKTSPAARHSRLEALGLLALVATLGLAPLPHAAAQEPATRARDLADVFGPDGSIAVPYDELLRLIRGDDQPAPGPVDTRAPSGFVLVGATVKATARESVVELEATVDLDLVGAEGWVVVPLRLKQAALKGATIDGKPAVISALADLIDLPTGRGITPTTYGYGVLVRGKGRKTLVLTGELPLQRGAGSANLALDLPAAALTKFVLDVPSSDAALSGELTREEAKTEDGRATITASSTFASSRPRPRASKSRSRAGRRSSRSRACPWLATPSPSRSQAASW